MTQTLERATIHRALLLIRDRRNWTRFAVTRRVNGMKCAPFDEHAMRYCAFGALARAAKEISGSNDKRLIESAERTIIRSNGFPPHVRLAALNDRFGHNAIVKAFERALKSQ